MLIESVEIYIVQMYIREWLEPSQSNRGEKSISNRCEEKNCYCNIVITSYSSGEELFNDITPEIKTKVHYLSS